MYREISNCRICGNTQLVEVLDLGVQALTGVFPRTKDQQITAGPLKLVKCTGQQDVCGLLQLQHTYDLSELYGDNYGYRSGLNASMVAHLHGKVRRILERVALPENPLAIDIGSNDGTTLRAFPEQGFTLIGVDPTGAKFKEFYPDHIGLIPDFFSAENVREYLGERKASIITSFSMFYDLEEPMKFVEEIRDVLETEGIWVLEQSYMPSMLARNSYDTVCHEHLEYYGLKQIKWMTDRAGLRILDVEFNDINGGSFSITVGKQGSRHVESPNVVQVLEKETRDGFDTLQPYEAFAQRIDANRQALRAFLDETTHLGKTVGVIGASTKGNVLLQYCSVSEADVIGVGEVNPDKFGVFTPGSLLPIVPEEEILAAQPDYLLVLPWHFRSFLIEQPRFAERNLLFPLPELDVVRCPRQSRTAAHT